MSKRYLYVGPTLPDAADICAGIGIKVLPPAAAGDLLAADLAVGDQVGIIDGYFHQRPSVRHKEILHLLDSGVHVLGAASIGALRAAELSAFGMEGVGGIAADYQSGRLVADDEVAVLHCTEEEGYRALSQPLVNLRAVLAAAVDKGLCDSGVRDLLVTRLMTTPYRLRGYPLLVRLALAGGMAQETADRLFSFCQDSPIDRKREDALALVERLGRDWREPPRIELNTTVHLHRWKEAAETDLDRAALRTWQILSPQWPEEYRQLVCDLLVADCRSLCEAAQPDAIAHAEHRGLFGADPRPLLDGWTTAPERRECDTRELLVRVLVRSYQVGPGISPDRACRESLRTRPGHSVIRDLARRSRDLNLRAAVQRPEFRPEAIAGVDVQELLATLWKVPAADLRLAALSRGFRSLGEALDAARSNYLLARLGSPDEWSKHAVDSIR